MERKYNARLVPMDKDLNATEINDIIKLVKRTPDGELGTIGISKNKMLGNDYWQPQRMVITSDETINFGWYIDDIGQLRKSVTDDADYWSVRKEYKKVIATYPGVLGIPCIDLVDVRVWVDKMCPDEVYLEASDVFVFGNYINTCACCKSTIHNTGKLWFLCKSCSVIPTLINNTVNIQWREPYVDERQFLKKDREYNETGYREEEENEDEKVNMPPDTSKLSRVEVIGNGREYVNMNTGKVELSFQDDNRTLKIFVEKGRQQHPPIDWRDIADKYYKQDVPNMTAEAIFNWFKNQMDGK
jgi:hypothetical protein